jgi:CDP-glucose 4,6-dehydratase
MHHGKSGNNMFGSVYAGKKVLITGHTGFKGSWLTTWLLQLGAKICGISKDIPTKPSMFAELQLENKIEHHIADVRDLEQMKEIILSFKPDFVFHLAAQPIVSLSYSDPIETLSTNVMGTAHILEALRGLNNICHAVIITSDKCYENVEWLWGYKETDPLGGKDVYSASKGAAEIVFHAYQQSFFNLPDSKVKIAAARAGNVIGGGDWADDRIVADCMRAWSNEKIVEIRSPTATRPWQHVLEPLSGYLVLGQDLVTNGTAHGESFNFGPKAEQSHTVKDLLNELSLYWDFNSKEEAYQITDNIPFHEAGLLKLNCDKALFHLKWEANLTYKQCIEYVSQWYYCFYKEDRDMFSLTVSQIKEYQVHAIKGRLVWTDL